MSSTPLTSPVPPSGRHHALETPPPPQGVWNEWKDAVATRTVILIIGVLGLQLAFILSYVGAFHSPAPSEISIAVVAPEQISSELVPQLNSLDGAPLRATAVADGATARQQILDDTTSAALIVDPAGTADTLLVASGGGTSVSGAVQSVISGVQTAQQRSVVVEDLVPLQPGDGRGLIGFYLVIGWIVGGYLVAALLGVSAGSRPATTRRAIFRLGALVPYAVLSGLGGAIIVDPVLGALTGHFAALWALGALLVFTAGAVTMAFQVVFGVLGIGLTVLVFVILGNPTAGGAYQAQLLPPFWRTLGGVLPNGAGTETIRRIVYFGSQGIAGQLTVIVAWAVVGTVVAILASRFHYHRALAVQYPAVQYPAIPYPAEELTEGSTLRASARPTTRHRSSTTRQRPSTTSGERRAESEPGTARV